MAGGYPCHMRYESVRVSLGRRFAALMLDWLSCYFIVTAISGGIGAVVPIRPFYVLGLFLTQIFMLSWLQGASLGHRIFGIKIVRYVDGGPINARQAFIRSFLLVTVIFAITFDEEGRGLHERFSQTILIRS
jgi:uncharacterized RDD family membrane protein YckC